MLSRACSVYVVLLVRRLLSALPMVKSSFDRLRMTGAALTKTKPRVLSKVLCHPMSSATHARRPTSASAEL